MVFSESKIIIPSTYDFTLLKTLCIIFFRRDLTSDCESELPNRVNTSDRLTALREEMKNHQIDAYYVPLDDLGRRTWISGFSGSNGDAIVTKDRVRQG